MSDSRTDGVRFDLLADVLDNSPDGVVLADAAGRVIAWNAAFLNASGLTRDVLASATIDTVDGCLAIVDVDDHGAELAGRSNVTRHIVTAPDGRPFERMERRINLSPTEKGRLVWYSPFDLESGLANPEQVQLQSFAERRRHALRMEAVGRLAGGIAHDFNNMLTVMIGFAEQLQIEIGEHDSLTQVVRAAQRAADLTRQLLAFSRQQVLRPRVVDVAAVVDAMAGMIGRLIGDHIRLTLEVPSGLPNVCADPAQLEQIVLNLAINARDAMPRGGRLTIAVHEANLDTPLPGRDVQPPGRYLQLTVTDTGDGIAPELLNKVFEPFFTTKGSQGTGLGLSTVYGIVKQSGGFIWVDSAVGQGTTFTIDLPAVTAHKDVVPLPERPAATSTERAGSRILIVEDLDSVRALAREMLVAAGYDVLDAGSPREALDIIERTRKPFDLVLSDVMMPEMTGKQLAGAIRERCPGVPVLFMSGLPKALDLDEPEAFLAKPFTRAALLEHVRERLVASEATPIAGTL